MFNAPVGANAERSRHHNRQIVLGHIRAEERMGRAEIARASGLSIQAVSNITADLVENGLIRVQGRRTAGRGLPTVLYSLNPEGGFALGIEIRPDAVLGTVLNLCSTPLISERRELPCPDRETITRTVQGLCRDILDQTQTPPESVLGAGIVMPGPFGQTGIQGSGSDLPTWEDVTPEQWFTERLNMPVLVEKDANAAAIAEMTNGVAKDLGTFAFLYFGRGLGLGTVSNGQLMRGSNGNAGEIGHIPVPTAGGLVPLESLVSRLSIERQLADEGIKAANGSDLSELYARKDPALMRWLKAATSPLTTALSIVENLLDPQTVILGGAMPDPILEHLVVSVDLPTRSVSQHPDRSLPRLMRGSSGRMTATLGAAALVINRVFTPKISVQQ